MDQNENYTLPTIAPRRPPEAPQTHLPPRLRRRRRWQGMTIANVMVSTQGMFEYGQVREALVRSSWIPRVECVWGGGPRVWARPTHAPDVARKGCLEGVPSSTRRSVISWVGGLSGCLYSSHPRIRRRQVKCCFHRLRGTHLHDPVFPRALHEVLGGAQVKRCFRRLHGTQPHGPVLSTHTRRKEKPSACLFASCLRRPEIPEESARKLTPLGFSFIVGLAVVGFCILSRSHALQSQS